MAARAALCVQVQNLAKGVEPAKPQRQKASQQRQHAAGKILANVVAAV